MPGLYVRERKQPGETTRKPGVGRGDDGEVSSAARVTLNEASRFYGKRVKNNKYGRGNVIFVNTDEPFNKVTVKFDDHEEPRKFLDMPGCSDPLEITGKIAKRTTKGRETRVTEMALTAVPA